jgi:hypothetical protein
VIAPATKEFMQTSVERQEFQVGSTESSIRLLREPLLPLAHGVGMSDAMAGYMKDCSHKISFPPRRL